MIAMAGNTKVREDDARGGGNAIKPAHGGAIGQEPHVPTETTRGQVETMAGLGMTQADIGKVLKVSPDTLQRHYADELAAGKAVKGAAYRQRLHDMVMGTNAPAGASPDAILRASVPSLFFALKTQFGFRERERADPIPDGPTTNESPAAKVRERLRSLTERNTPAPAPEAGGDGEQ